ncbi:hypothetical protein T439DRAFT_379285 [Meredithblackwellia eburnea MCA 4105]
MTIVDPSHPKSQMAFSRSGSASASSNGVPDTEPPPQYHLDNPLLASNDLLLPDTNINDLNPEIRKKLTRDANDNDRDIHDYGVHSDHHNLRAGELPPDFAALEADVRPAYSISSEGDIVTHDSSLNSSPDSLLRFLRLHCTSPPTLTIHVRGHHTERRTETTYENDHNGHRKVRHHTRDVEVEDFEFRIEGGDYVEQGLGKAVRGGGGVRGVMYEVGGWEAAHRGGPWRVRERLVGEEDSASSSSRRGRAGQGAIRLPIEPDEEEGQQLGGGAAGLLERKASSAGMGRWKRPGVREMRKLDRGRRERDSRGFPGFVHPDCLQDMEEDHRPSAERTIHPALLYHSHFVDLVETHSSLSPSISSSSNNNNNSPQVSQEYTSVLAEREARDENVRKVVEAYCKSDRLLKELRVRKEVFGWNWRLLEAGIRATIDQARYTGTVQVQFKTTPQTIVIRPENNLSRIFSLPIWAKILLWIVLVYPILLLIELFNGDRYDNLRVAFPLTRWRRLPVPVPSSSSSSPGPSSSSSTTLSTTQALELARPLTTGRASPKVAQLPTDGTMVYLIGTQDGEFLKAWEDAIVDGVRRGRRGVALTQIEREGVYVGIRESLRGYSG